MRRLEVTAGFCRAWFRAEHGASQSLRPLFKAQRHTHFTSPPRSTASASPLLCAHTTVATNTHQHPPTVCALSQPAAAAIMQAHSMLLQQRQHQPACLVGRSRQQSSNCQLQPISRTPRLAVAADSTARVRGDSRRVHRWLSDVRHWTSFYPGGQPGRRGVLGKKQMHTTTIILQTETQSCKHAVPQPGCKPAFHWLHVHTLLADRAAGSQSQRSTWLSWQRRTSRRQNEASLSPAHAIATCHLTNTSPNTHHRHQVCCEAWQRPGPHPRGHQV